jgi:large subunit ribosomal protein L30
MPAKKSDSGEVEKKPKPRMKASKDAFSQESPRTPRKTKTPAEKKPKVAKAAEIEEKEETKAAPHENHEKKEKLFAVVRVRGSVGITRDLADTLMMLRLHRINHCVIVPKNQNFNGMLHKARNFITWGEIDKETLEKLVAKRGRFAGDKRVTDLNYAKELAHLIISGKPVKETGIKPVFRLSPPSKGYKSTKALFPKGSLGYRGERINELLKRMI